MYMNSNTIIERLEFAPKRAVNLSFIADIDDGEDTFFSF